MRHGVISDFMSLGDDSSHDFRVASRIGRDHIEGGFHVLFLQDVEQSRRIGGVWTVVKSECNERQACADA